MALIETHTFDTSYSMIRSTKEYQVPRYSRVACCTLVAEKRVCRHHPTVRAYLRFVGVVVVSLVVSLFPLSLSLCNLTPTAVRTSWAASRVGHSRTFRSISLCLDRPRVRLLQLCLRNPPPTQISVGMDCTQSPSRMDDFENGRSSTHPP